VGTQEDGLNQIEVCYGSLVSTTGEVVAFLERAAE